MCKRRTRHALGRVGASWQDAKCLLPRGFTKNTVARGTLIVVNGYRAKDGSHTVNGTNVTLPDGRRLFTGSSGSGAPAQ